MKTIPITQFIPPNGQRVQVETDVQDDEYAKFLELTQKGARLTVERLMNGVISQCIEHPEVGDFDMELSQNDETVVSKRREMLLRFDGGKFDRWIKMMNDGNEEDEPQ